MQQVDDTNPSSRRARNVTLSMRAEVRALIALGWMPSLDEPWRIYALRGDTVSPIPTTNEIWWAMHEVLARDGELTGPS